MTDHNTSLATPTTSSTVAKLQKEMRSVINRDVQTILKTCYTPDANQFKMTTKIQINKNLLLKWTLTFGELELTLNSSKTGDKSSAWEYHGRIPPGEGFFGGGGFFGHVHDLNDAESFHETFGDMSPGAVQFLNTTEACFTRLGDYWEDDKGRSISEFIEYAIEQHGDGFGPATWRVKGCNKE
jgi:hypothetical protein